MTDFEAQRQVQIEKNKARLRELGLLETVREMNSSIAQVRQQSREQKAARKAVAVPRPPQRIRRSERVQGQEAPNYNERELQKLGLDDENDSGRRPRLLRENSTEEVYTFEQVKLLGSSAQPWELFVDGYDASGERIYDKVNGQTCHQCRQKTLGKRTSCSCCNSLRGVFCGDCLYMRYGENVNEVNANPGWVCPVCRDLCNCSFHRIKKGWAPTGTLYRAAMREGFQSVAHYLVLTRLREEDQPLAAHLVPEGYQHYPATTSDADESVATTCAVGDSSAEASSTAVTDQLLSLPADEGSEPASSSGSQETAAAASNEQPPSRRSRRAQGSVATTKPLEAFLLPMGERDVEGNAAAAGEPSKGVRRSGRNMGVGRQATLMEVSRATKRKATEPATGATPAPAKKQAGETDIGRVGSASRGLRSAAGIL